jgi:uncharacterized protein
MQHRLILLLITSLTLNSCYLNKSFLQPFKASQTKKSYTMRDSTVVFFEGENHQPTFTKNGKDTINYPFTIKSVMFNSENGHKLNGWILKPKNAKPTITLIHFHANSGMLLTQVVAISPLLKQGFQIFMFDYSGFGFSEGNAERKNVLTDGISAVDYVKNSPEFQNTKLVIYGQSFGGHLATVVATKKQNDIDALVSEGAFSSHDDIAGQGIWTIMARLTVKEMYAAKTYIKDFKKPVLIIHSDEDKTIPFKMGKKLYRKANQPKELFEIKGSHIMGPNLYPKEIAEKIKQMVK